MENYLDQSILQKREEEKKKKFRKLDTGVYIDGEVVEFERVNINDIFSIMLPTTFEVMPAEFARVKYNSEFRPQRIYTNAELDTNLGFTTFPDEMKIKDTENLAKRIQQIVCRESPGCQLLEVSQLEEINGHWFSLHSHALDSDFFNMMLLTPMKKTILQASFNCPFTKAEVWKHTVLQMWETIECESRDEL